LTLHGKIETGELLSRRAENGGGAGIVVEQIDGQSGIAQPVTLGSR
jgi:hypothetical protein